MKRLFLILTILTIMVLVFCHREEVGWISITSTPEGAEVYLDDSITGEVTNCVLNEIPAGEHHLKLTLEDYFDWKDSVTVEVDDTLKVNAELISIEEFGYISVTSYPSGAEVFLDGDYTEYITDCILDSVPIGDHIITLKLNDYKNWEKDITIELDDTVHLNAYLICDTVEEGQLKWRADTCGYVSSTPAVGGDGTIYCGGSDSLGAYLYAFSRDGSLKWKCKVGGYLDCAPTISPEGTIYVGSEDDHLYAINSEGTIQWKYKTGWNVRSSPAISTDGTIYFGSMDGNLYAMSPAGDLIWKRDAGSEVRASPAIGVDGSIYVVSMGGGDYKGYIYAFSSQGNILWGDTIDIYPDVSSPAIGSDGTIYFGANDYHLYAYSSEGDPKWKYRTGSYVKSSPVIGEDNVVYFGSYDGYLYALNPNGSIRWKYNAGTEIFAAPTLGADGTVYFTTWDDFGSEYYIYALTSTGSFKWKYKTWGSNSSSAIGPDGTLYVGGSGLHAFYTYSQGLADSPWPKYCHDNQNTGNAAWPIK